MTIDPARTTCIHVTRPNDEKENRALHGLTRTLLNNMVVGVTEGYQEGTGRSTASATVLAKEGKKLVMNMGYLPPGDRGRDRRHHHRAFPAPTRSSSAAPTSRRSASLPLRSERSVRPEPYKGKGIKYTDEVIRRKEGKTGVKK